MRYPNKCSFEAYGRTYYLTTDAADDHRPELRGIVPLDDAGKPCVHHKDPHWYDWRSDRSMWFRPLAPRPIADVIPINEGVQVTPPQEDGHELTFVEKMDLVLNSADWFSIMSDVLRSEPLEFLKLRGRMIQADMKQEREAPVTVVVNTLQENNTNIEQS